MTRKQTFTNDRSVIKLAWSAVTLSMLLAVSACSSNNSTDEPVEVEPETSVVEAEEPVVEPAPSAEEAPVEETPTDEAIEVPADETVSVDEGAEPEVLAANAGMTLYEGQCKVCHEKGLLEAPKYGDTAAWSTRLTQGKETLYLHSSKGFNKMPAQVSDKVSTAQVHAAVDYMIEAVS